MKKKLALIFAILVLSQTLFSCSDTSEDTTLSETASSMAETGGTAGEESAETIAEEETRQMHAVPSDLDYGGETFTIVYPNWQGYNYYFFANEYTGDVMNDAIFSRKSKVEDAIKITLTEVCPGYIEQIFPTVSASVKSDDDAYQLVLLHCIDGVASMVRGGLLYNLDDLNHTDLDAPWWNHRMMNELRLGKNTYYGVSDYMIPCPYTIYFNKDIVTECGLENPYELVYNKEWTVDKFISMAEGATADLDGNGKITNNDRRGVSYDETSKWISFMSGAGQKMLERSDDGEWKLGMNTEKMQTLVEKFYSLAIKDGVIAPANSLSVADGNLLFELNTLAHAVNYRETECNIGLLPYPLFDENQENYISLDWGGLMGCPTTIRNPDMVGATLELLAYESGNEVIPAYYEKLLEGKIARDEDTVAMLDIIFDTITYEPVGNYFGFDGGVNPIFYTIGSLAVESKSADYASYYKKNEKLASKVMERFFKDLEKVESMAE